MEEDEKQAAEVGEDARYLGTDNILIPGQRDSGFSESLAGMSKVCVGGQGMSLGYNEI